MKSPLPFLTASDPEAASEGSLDPLGLAPIADHLATMLVPAVRERMLRIRFLTAMAVGTHVTEDLSGDMGGRGVHTSLVWEWYVVEAFVRSAPSRGAAGAVWGVPGTDVARRAISHHGYLDASSYLATPRVFGFHGVYKRLAIQLGITDEQLRRGPETDALVEAWARNRGMGDLRGSTPIISKWKRLLEAALRHKPPRTLKTPGWTNDDWQELAAAFVPDGAKSDERHHLRRLLLDRGQRRLGALPDLWKLQADIPDDESIDRSLHERLRRLKTADRDYVPLLDAIHAYEMFSRALQDAFDIIRHRAGGQYARGFELPSIARDGDFASCAAGLDRKFAAASEKLQALGDGGASDHALLSARFQDFAQPMDGAAVALALHALHVQVQLGKSKDGKRSWFDVRGVNRIAVRPGYGVDRPVPDPSRYVHAYRGAPIRRFWRDLVTQ